MDIICVFSVFFVITKLLSVVAIKSDCCDELYQYCVLITCERT